MIKPTRYNESNADTAISQYQNGSSTTLHIDDQILSEANFDDEALTKAKEKDSSGKGRILKCWNTSRVEYAIAWIILALFCIGSIYLLLYFLSPELSARNNSCSYLPLCSNSNRLDDIPECATNYYYMFMDKLEGSVASLSPMMNIDSCDASNLAIWQMSIEHMNGSEGSLIYPHLEDENNGYFLSKFVLYTFYFSIGLISPGNDVLKKELRSPFMQQKKNDFCIYKGIICTARGTIMLIDLEHIGIQGTIPSEIGLLSDLRILRLGNNAIHGTIPTEISQLNHLRELSLHDNFLSGTIPPVSPSALKRLELSNNMLTGDLHELPFIPNLHVLNLASNQLTGKFPRKLGKSTFLYFIDVSNNLISDQIHSNTFPTEHLEYLILGDNDKLDLQEFYLPPYRLLVNLDLRGGINLRDDWDTMISSLKMLKSLNLNNMGLRGELPSSIRNLLLLEEMDISNNDIRGTIPSDLGKCDLLRSLDISSNNLTGDIPKSLGNLKQLHTLRLGNNHLEGKVPDEVCALRYYFSLSTIESDLESHCKLR